MQVAKVRDENMHKLLEEESQQQPTAATKVNKRSKKANRGKQTRGRPFASKEKSNQKEIDSAGFL